MRQAAGREGRQSGQEVSVMGREQQRARRGQSIIEYLLIAAVVILGVVALSGGFKGSIESMGSTSSGQVGAASSALGGMTVADH